MSDVSKFLPLSQRGSGDESNVSGDWSSHVDASLALIAHILHTADDTSLDLPAQGTGYRVRDTVGHLVWRLSLSRRARLNAVATTMISSRCSAASAVRNFSVGAGEGSALQLEHKLSALRAARASSGVRAPIGDLVCAVVDGYDIAQSLNRPIATDPVASGAVALAKSTGASTPVRAVIRGRTLVASDAQWSVGHGPALSGTAQQLVLLLAGRGPVPSA
ncbi:MAG TPA: hypothetical protein VGP24_10590 [Glaciihabitans sp.]|jgi:hypothetical protein|nr:hypothetical protein [Glaciihabitans sp.]